jgi:hypothetical protein
MCSHESKKIFYHEWIGYKKKKPGNKIYKFLEELYPNKKLDEIELLSQLYTEEDCKILARDHGFDEKQIQKLTSIDGSLLLLSNGECHAIGVILDGKATEQEDSSRGARYNSAIRYSQSIKGKINHLIVVISEDGMIDFIS